MRDHRHLAVLAAHREHNAKRLVLLAWVRCGSWETAEICSALEALCRLVWAERWEGPLVDLGLHTVPAVKAVVETVRREATQCAGVPVR